VNEEKGDYIVSVFNLTGYRIYSVRNTKKDLLIDMALFPAGIYTLQYSTSKKTIREKVIKL